MKTIEEAKEKLKNLGMSENEVDDFIQSLKNIQEDQPVFKIEILYESGNSFGRQDEEEILEPIWNDYNLVCENIKNIEKHFELVKLDRWGHKNLQEIFEKAKQTYYWFVDEYSIKLKLDNGNFLQISAPWSDYFCNSLGVNLITLKK